MNSLFPFLSFSLSHPLSISLLPLLLLSSVSPTSLVIVTRAHSLIRLSACKRLSSFVVLCGPCPTIPGLNCNYFYCERARARSPSAIPLQNNEADDFRDRNAPAADCFAQRMIHGSLRYRADQRRISSRRRVLGGSGKLLFRPFISFAGLIDKIITRRSAESNKRAHLVRFNARAVAVVVPITFAATRILNCI